MSLQHLNKEETFLRIVYRYRLDALVEETNESPVWSKWLLYSFANCSIWCPSHSSRSDIADKIAALENKIKKLKRRNPKDEFGIVRIREIRWIEEMYGEQ